MKVKVGNDEEGFDIIYIEIGEDGLIETISEQRKISGLYHPGKWEDISTISELFKKWMFDDTYIYVLE